MTSRLSPPPPEQILLDEDGLGYHLADDVHLLVPYRLSAHTLSFISHRHDRQTRCLYLIQQRPKTSLLFDTVGLIYLFYFVLTSDHPIFLDFQALFRCPPSTSPSLVACI
jgi:hypothetical protein